MSQLTSGPNDSHTHFLKVSRQIQDDEKFICKSSFIRRALAIPFAPTWAFGVDILTKFRNLTTNKHNYKLFYTVSHVGIVYSHTTNDMQFLMGHRNLITSISSDESGKWLVSTDMGKDNTIIVWDGDDCFPVRTIFDPHPDVGVTQVGMSLDAKYLVSVGAEPEPVIKFWLWTYGNDEADGVYQAKSSFGSIKAISFNPNNCKYFAVTFSANLIFFTWDAKEKKLTEKIAEITRKKGRNFGFYTDTAYIPKSYECLSVTTNGWVIVWGLTFFTVPYESMPDSNNKIFIKAIKLQKDGIDFISLIDGVISTTDFRGNIRFYDEKLQILYFCHKFSLPPIIMISFNVSKRKYIIQDPMVMDSGRTEVEKEILEEEEEERTEETFTAQFQFNPTERKEKPEEKDEIQHVEEEQMLIKYETEESGAPITLEEEDEIHTITVLEEQSEVEQKSVGIEHEYEIDIKPGVIFEDEDRSEEYEKIYLNLLPSDFTLQRSPFLVRDYIILTTDGQFAYVDAIENKLDFFLSTNYSPVTCMDVHTEKPILILGYKNGLLYTYNYIEAKLLVKRCIMNKKEEQHNVLSSVKYSPQGIFLACGTGGGYLWFLDPVSANPIYKKAFIYEHSKITNIQFSSTCQYLAYSDVSGAVCLLKVTYNEADEKPEWIFYGRYIAHTKDVTGMLFCDKNRLFTIGMDRYLVEYDVKNSKLGILDIIIRVPIMQRGYPIAFTTYDLLCEEGTLYFLISTNEYKYLVLNYQTSTLERTILAPFFEDPVNRIQVIPNTTNKYMMFNTGKHLGMQMLPISGNPFKQVTIIAHSSHIELFNISSCGKFVFTYGENDNICIMWSMRFDALEYMFEQGGKQLSPYYSLIEGGSEGWLFREMKDLFYYMQILHQGEDSPMPRHVSDKIPTSELPNLMRAIGFYPTEFELDNILYEVKYFYIDNIDDDEEEINFENFLKLYINHRPVESFRKDEVKWAFEKICDDEDLTISKQCFIDTLCTKGEPFCKMSLQHCLSILTHHHTFDNASRFSFSEMLPEKLTYDYFMSEILGVENI